MADSSKNKDELKTFLLFILFTIIGIAFIILSQMDFDISREGSETMITLGFIILVLSFVIFNKNVEFIYKLLSYMFKSDKFNIIVISALTIGVLICISIYFNSKHRNFSDSGNIQFATIIIISALLLWSLGSLPGFIYHKVNVGVKGTGPDKVKENVAFATIDNSIYTKYIWCIFFLILIFVTFIWDIIINNGNSTNDIKSDISFWFILVFFLFYILLFGLLIYKLWTKDGDDNLFKKIITTTSSLRNTLVSKTTGEDDIGLRADNERDVNNTDILMDILYSNEDQTFDDIDNIY